MKEVKFTNEKICCIADLHIGVHQGNSIWHNISVDFAKWLKAQLNTNNIKDIIICGDVNNDRNEISVNTLHIINEFFKTLEEFNIVIIVGNHDAFYKNRSDINSLSLLAGWKNITIVDKLQSITQFDKLITLCPWGVELNDIPTSDIVFGHFDINGFYMNPVKLSTDGIKSGDILDKSKNIITGHFHMRDERRYQTGSILYLGSPYELTWGEYNNSKGIYIYDLMSTKYTFIENTVSPKHKKVKLSEIMAIGKISDDIKKEFYGNFVSFIIDKEIQQDKCEELTAKLYTLKPLSLHVEHELNEKATIEEINYEFTGVDIATAISEFVGVLDIKDKENVLKHTLELYKTFA